YQRFVGECITNLLERAKPRLARLKSQRQSHRLQHFHRRRNHFLPDAVAIYDRNQVIFPSLSLRGHFAHAIASLANRRCNIGSSPPSSRIACTEGESGGISNTLSPTNSRRAAR